jgi:hypothetical protein
MNRLLTAAAVAEAVTGVVLIVFPSIVVELLFGAEIAGTGVVMSRFAGVSLVALGVACWRGGTPDAALWAMLTYGALATLYLAYLGLAGEFAGILLWPAVVVHAGLSVVLVAARFRRNRGLDRRRS